MRPDNRHTFLDKSPLLKTWKAPSIDRFQLTAEQLDYIRSADDQSAELAKIYTDRKAARIGRRPG